MLEAIVPRLFLWAAGEVAQPKGLSDNVVLRLGLAASLAVALVALWRAGSQRGLDNAQIKVALAKHDEDKTRRIMRLENYATDDARYHREIERYQYKQENYQAKLIALLEHYIDQDLLHEQLPLPPGDPPVPPELPEVPGG